MTTRMERRRHASRPGRPYLAARAVVLHAGWIALFALPAVVLWWHVWSGHPSSTLTCACGDPAQEVWFMAWPAWAISHGANLFFSNAVNVPHGANLLSNTSGTLVAVVLAPVTWIWGPVTSTNVALVLAPALSSWGCWLALRRFVTWQPGCVPAALVYGYSSAMVTSLIFGHVSVTLLVIPPLLFATLYEIVIWQRNSVARDGATLAALLVVQFLISPEVVVMCGLFSAVGLVVAASAGWRQVLDKTPHAVRALGIGLGASVVLLAYPAWFGIGGTQAVSGVMFAIAPLSGVSLPGFFSPGPYGSYLTYVRFNGYLGRLGPTPNYVGWGVGAWAALSLLVARRRLLCLFLLLMALVASWLALGSYLQVGPRSYLHIWMPWRYLAELTVLKEILPDQFAPFIALFLAFLLAIGLDAVVSIIDQRVGQRVSVALAVSGGVTALLAVLALVPTFVTFDMPLRVTQVALPAWVRQGAPRLPSGSVVLTVPFAVSGSTTPMLWQAEDDMHFRLAGAALKTPNANGGPIRQGGPGSARRILTDLTVVGDTQPLGKGAEVATVRRALSAWHVNDVVITGPSRDPVYSSGFLTEAIGTAPTYVDSAWVWKVPNHLAPPAIGASLYLCRLAAPADDPLSMSACVVKAAALRRGQGGAP